MTILKLVLRIALYLGLACTLLVWAVVRAITVGTKVRA